MVLIHTLTAPVVPASSTAIRASGQRNVNYGREQVPFRNRAPVRVPVYVAASSQEPGTDDRVPGRSASGVCEVQGAGRKGKASMGSFPTCIKWIPCTTQGFSVNAQWQPPHTLIHIHMHIHATFICTYMPHSYAHTCPPHLP
jgi:hypothetical protein